ncbi:MAG: ADP-glyceromanno-heptose 6-epimerase [Flavobacteriales bacterium]|nr:ADP-glyceromanno-heptose 6-epimerase [Flavobacteriales bacterium]
MIVVTGAAGFIGSMLLRELQHRGYGDLVAVDDFSHPEKSHNLEGINLAQRVERSVFPEWIDANESLVQFIFHLGARTDTTEFNKAVFDELNVRSSQRIWERCAKYAIPLVHASSAATYGDGDLGYSDTDDALPYQLKPLNPYGESKNEFDKWALEQNAKPYFWAGLKFFNVYGPNEYHKGRMASVVFHAYNQITASGGMKLFRSHRPDYTDGGQLRDFVYVKDLCDVCIFLMEQRKHSGIYNLGSGKARTFLDLARATFNSMGKAEKIEFIDTPVDIRDKYQYFTEAPMGKLRGIGYAKPFHTLEEGVDDYVRKHLAKR